ncbi:MAG: hypothetical protein IKU00_04095 [Bacteroidales bacterium]|nr:hypothetical protein [Bacteroidales bacterium]
MKKTLSLLGGLLVLTALIFVSCKKDDEVTPTINKYFSVENASLIKKAMPEATVDDEIEVVMNSKVIPGGSSIVSLYTERIAKKILVGMKDQAGYYEILPSARGEYSFLMMINQDIDLGEDARGFTVLVAVEDENGDISKIWETSVELLVVGTGALQVSLSFDNAKDVDLHLIEPEYNDEYGDPVSFSDRHIYYSNKVAYYSGGELDLDSNPGCSIDNINNENITYSSDNSFIAPGTYKVYVDLFENCDYEIATNYVVTVFYGGALIASKSGVFEIGAESTYNPIDEDYVANNLPFLTFSIADKGQKSSKTYGRAPISESAMEKESYAVHK